MRNPVSLPLPTEIVPTAKPASVVWTWLATGVLVLLVNAAAVALLNRWTPNRGQELIRTKWEILRDLDPTVDNLVLGDSSGNQGADPAALGHRLGGKWVNLCTIGQMLLVGDAWMLNRYIEEHGPPKRVVIVRIADVWPLRVDPKLIAAVPREWGYWEHERPPVELDHRRELDVFLTRWAPLYTSEQSIAFVLKTPWRIPQVYRAIRDDGFMPMTGQRTEEFEPDLAAWLEFLDTNTFRVSSYNRAALDRILSLSDQHGFDVYFAHGPAWEKLVADPRYQSWFAEAHAMLEEVARQHPRFHLVFDRPQPFPYEQLQDVEHLTAEGAAIFTRNLAEAIQRIESDGVAPRQ